jgi:hypothetical protein
MWQAAGGETPAAVSVAGAGQEEKSRHVIRMSPTGSAGLHNCALVDGVREGSAQMSS